MLPISYNRSVGNTFYECLFLMDFGPWRKGEVVAELFIDVQEGSVYEPCLGVPEKFISVRMVTHAWRTRKESIPWWPET